MVKYVYNAWGRCRSTGNSTIASINPYRYRGYYYDTESGLYFLQTRYYDPYTGRFLSMDDVEYIDPEAIGGVNLYAYCNNNPVMNVDYIGRLPVPIEIVTSLIGYSADLYSFCLKLSLKNMPKLSMASAKELARKSGNFKSARSFIKARNNSIVEARNIRKSVDNFGKYFGRAMLGADIIFNVAENIINDSRNWVSDTIVDVGISVGIYALGSIPFVGWALAIGATALVEIFDEEIEEFKDWFAEGWNEFWSFSWL